MDIPQNHKINPQNHKINPMMDIPQNQKINTMMDEHTSKSQNELRIYLKITKLTL